ncbi:zf-HC2 domain-containing protein [Streptomyces sp. NPDC021098]|uniref:zf-HC2 domain-containing protein n=1 Tax=unclassified Streptomyces TaxID=2593676 RepID=UPI0037B703F0
MHCSRIRTALSARLDGEEMPPGITERQMAAHLGTCADCRLWEDRARRLTEHIAGLRDTETDPGTEAPEPPPQVF